MMRSPSKLAALASVLPAALLVAAAWADCYGQQARKDSQTRSETVVSRSTQETAPGRNQVREAGKDRETVTSRETQVEGAIVERGPSRSVESVQPGGEPAPVSSLAECTPSASATISSPTAEVSGPANPFGQVAVTCQFKYTVNCSTGNSVPGPFCYGYLIERQSGNTWQFGDREQNRVGRGLRRHGQLHRERQQV